MCCEGIIIMECALVFTIDIMKIKDFGINHSYFTLIYYSSILMILWRSYKYNYAYQ